MRTFLSWPIRVHMFLLVLLLALPAMGVFVYSGIRERREAVEESSEEVEKLVHTVASEIELLVDNTRQLSLTLAHLTEVQSRNAAVLNPLLKELSLHFPYYTMIFITDKDGLVWASSQPAPIGRSLADRRYVRDAISTGQFSAGEFAIGRVTGLPTFSFGYPFRDGKGRAAGVIGISVNLRTTEHLLLRARIPHDTTYTIFDRNGTLLFRGTDANRDVGKRDKTELFQRVQEGPDQGIFEARTNDAVSRRMAYRKLRLANGQPPYMYVRASIPTGDATKAANSALLKNLALFAPFLVAALALGWFVGRRCVVDRVHALRAASRSLAAGDLTARVAGRVHGGELGELAHAFDSMALSLQSHEKELHDKNELLRAVIEGTSDAIFVKDLEGRYLLFNSGAAALTGKSVTEVIGKDDTYLFPLEVAQMLKEKDRVLMENGQMVVCEEVVVDGSGSPRVMFATKGPIRDAGGNITGMFGIARDITRRNQVERERERLIVELDNERLRFESVLQQMPVAVVIAEASSGRVTYSNTEAARIFRYSIATGEAIDDYSRWRLFQLDGSPLSWEHNPLNRALRSGEVTIGEELLIERRDATTGFVRCNAAPIRDIDGHIVGSVVAFFDITVHAKAAEALRASEQHMRRVLDNLFAFVGVLTPDGTLIEVNRAALEAGGISSGDIVGRPFEEMHWWSWSPQVQGQLREAIARAAAGETVRYDVLFRQRDGQLHPVDFMLAPLRDDHGNITHLVPSGIDITARKQAEMALQEANDDLEHRVEARTVELARTVTSLKKEIADREKAEKTLCENERILRALVDTNPESLLLIDAEGTILVINDTCARRLNQGVPEATGKNVFSLLPPEVGATRRKYVEEAIASGQPLRFEDVRYGRFIEHYIHPIIDVKGKVKQLAILGIDLTDHKRTEEALKQETAQRVEALESLREQERIMIQQSRLAAMGEMISNIAHQWRQPLNTLGMVVQRLQLFHDMGEFSADFLSTSTKDAMRLIKHMSGTIDDFSNFFKPDKGMVAFSVNETIRQTISLVEASFKNQQIGLSIYAEGEPLINGYPNEYSQVLLNILLNARDALVERAREDARIEVRSFVQDGATVVTIADNAGGIPEEIMDKIFDPHFTTKGPQGSGIGLFMAKNIIERNMRGRLTVRNAGNGAEFRIEV